LTNLTEVNEMSNHEGGSARVLSGELRPDGVLHQMFMQLASNIMRTTLDIDDLVLREVKAIHEREGRSIGAVVSELLAEALARRVLGHRSAGLLAL
jgi:hypothetical protein